MGSRGPAPKPAKLKLLTGNPSKRPVQDEFEPQGVLAAPPADFTDLQLTIWERVTAAMGGFITAADWYQLRNFCVAQAHLMEIESKLAATGNLVTMNGKTQTNPLFKMRNALFRSSSELGSSLGLSPAARARIGQQESQGAPADQEYLKLIGAA